MKTTVNSTKELKAIFTELSRTDRFKRALDVLFKKGYSFEISYADNFRAYASQEGLKYKAKIGYKGTFYRVKKTIVTRMCVPESWLKNTPDKYRNISSVSDGTLTIGSVTENTFHADREQINLIDWASIATKIGKLIKSEITEVCDCSKCGGSGFLPNFAYYAEGVCFECMGMGKDIKMIDKC